MSRPHESPLLMRATATFLCIPELLDLVFYFVPQDSLRRTVILVCRKWFFLNRHRVSRQLSWDYEWFTDDAAQALKRLPGAGRLVWRCNLYCENTWPKLLKSLNGLEKRHSFPSSRSMWRRRPINAAQGNNDLKNSHSNNNNTTNNNQYQIYNPLQHVELFSNYHLSDESLNLLPFPSTLTTLKIYRYSISSLDIARILAICPHLEILHTGSRELLTLQGSWMSREPAPSPDLLPLRSLVLKNVKLTQAWLERLVSRTPQLKELKLINLSSPSGTAWDWASFSQHLRSQSFVLHKFHYSVHGEVPSDDDLVDMLYTLCPNRLERTLWSYNLTPGVVRRLTEQPSILTTLDVLWHHKMVCHSDGWKEGDHFYSSASLHRLLCESPGLRHLKTLKAPYLIEHMDVHRRARTFYESMFPEPVEGREMPIFHPGVWVCRNLQVLHLQVHSHGGYDLRGTHERRVLLGYISRTLFSYISKVTPQLRDLHIEEPYFCSIFTGVFSFHTHLSEHLFGGLPLLSSLRYLERLRVEFEDISCDISQLSWIYGAGRTLQDMGARRAIMSKWEGQLEHEAQMEATRLQSTPIIPLSGMWLYDFELLKDLGSTGLLQEVKTRLEEIDKGECECFPSLQKLSLRGELERSPERSMGSIFPMLPAKKSIWSMFRS
ncbi:hypothetical protein BGZ96_007269 [Linnemannia gamsii]|uniref:F-box domain-containing protein n=1 Tax=Linnemannia gamsii TaxID=64522 RepID=A0ABQ7KFJ0_9FUNG|nr:hypothetical protein BGZ96_007269 [Linnemannia gamsii]